MNWISDRNPKSKGMYLVKLKEIDQFTFQYFDGKGWVTACDAAYPIKTYLIKPTWSKIDWGKDKNFKKSEQ